MSASNEILLKGDYTSYEEAKVAAGQTIRPGMLCDLNAAGELVALTTAKNVPLKIALINVFLGKTKTDPYAAGEVARFFTPSPGFLVDVLCLSGEIINVGTQVVSGLNGRGVAATGTPAKVLGVSEETVGVLTSDRHVAVRIN